MSKLPDIDIDFADNRAAMAAVGAIPAMVLRDDSPQPHPSGAYLQDIPINPITGLAAFEFREAEEKGFSKIDFLNQSIYREIRDEQHLIELMNREPEWSLLEEENFVNQLPHIKDHYAVLQAIEPKSVEDLAVVLALIRPGKKRLIGQPRHEIDRHIWAMTEEDGYVFRKAHAISYAMLIVVKMNLIVDQMLAEMED